MLKLAALHNAIGECRRCEESGLEISKPAIMNRGASQAMVMVIGLAPGQAAIKAEKAFAGNSMTRLLKWFSMAGMELSEAEFRASTYLTSLNKCAVSPDTEANRRKLWGRCDSFLSQQIDLVQPRLILVLGKEAANLLARDKISDWQNILGTCWSTGQLFEGNLFPPTRTTPLWLFMPHPSGLSRTMNDEANSAKVIGSLHSALNNIGFKPKAP